MPAKPDKSKQPTPAAPAGRKGRPAKRMSDKDNRSTAPGKARRPPQPLDAPKAAKAAVQKARPGVAARKAAAAQLPPRVIAEMFRRFAEAAPAPKGELEHVNPFTLLVAVVLSAQSTDAGVNKATRALFRLADTPQKMVALGEERVRDLIKTIGLFRNKAKNTILLSQGLIDRHQGEVPCDRESLEALPGVGRKTANVVLNSAFGQPTIAVDTHILRLGNRLSLAPGKTPLEVEQKLMQVIPPEYLLNAHHWLILHGRYVCKAQRPRCADCLIADLCRSPDKAAWPT